MAADSPSETGAAEPRIDDFANEPPRSLDSWQWLWERDHLLPAPERGFPGRLLGGLRAALRPLARLLNGEQEARQRIFNLIAIEHLRGLRNDLDQRSEELERRAERIEKHNVLQGRRSEELERRAERIEKHNMLQGRRSEELERRAERIEKHNVLQDQRYEEREHRTLHLENFLKEGLEELMRYSDALYSRMDQKVDRFRGATRDLDRQLSAALALTTDGTQPASLERVVEEGEYRELEARYRGTSEEIAERISTYLPTLEKRTSVLDLGCGRGEALKVMTEAGIGCSGVDESEDMVGMCLEAGYTADVGDALSHLTELDEGSLDGVVSFHVIEHLPATAVNRLVRLAWRALEPGGVLILETPNPLSVVVAASHFWRDPTHLRPIHPDALWLSFEMAGFEKIESRMLRPFLQEDRLPEIDLEGLDGETRNLAHRVNELRDRLDDALFGYQDYAVIGYRE